MTTRKQHEPAPQTLMQAHELLSRMRPSSSASADLWLKYYRRSAAVYAEVAEIDRGHHHEAMYWATRERDKANKLQAQVTKKLDPPVVTTVKDEPGKPAETEVSLGKPTVHYEL